MTKKNNPIKQSGNARPRKAVRPERVFSTRNKHAHKAVGAEDQESEYRLLRSRRADRGPEKSGGHNDVALHGPPADESIVFSGKY